MRIEKYPDKIPVLESERLLLRPITIEDAEDIYEYATDKDVAEFVIWDVHKNKQETLDFINVALNQFSQKQSITWGLELKSEKKIIGTIAFVNVYLNHECAEVGYALSKKYWNRGFVTEAIKAVIKYGFDELSLNRIEAHCEEANIGSWKVMEKAGMKYEGVLREKVFMKGRFRSMKMYSILKKELATE